MHRRVFLVNSSLFSATALLNAKGLFDAKNSLLWSVIEEVLEIVFPKTKHMPSASEFGAVDYLLKNINHKTFDKDDLNYLLQGAKDFNSSFPKFLKASLEEKNRIIKQVSQNSYGQNWLSYLIYYGIEAMLSDPIYGGNKNQIAYESLKFQAGEPRPKVKYGKTDGL
ncbi:gluconate 2-dehydrogenase subunit 3 family protein [Malaciobacter marinus]|uniref:Gluconate 2-dehydrogenase subunit 3 n=1 Tax=Malaciobacter marinus TaxID=505249 RepID=A0A347TP88_9BACT|nr:MULTISPECIES: gluconate 2-dehydrogenase subunit 3 family protein [Malaciobacter]AXX88416.1 hypothetical protein AMRN_2718 [Malaciobacter marinus]PHO13449.1 hypothetical protein CPG38_03055 [Malaciobacter marinus]PHO16681.1 hypothetical protein CPH92_00675 [Malaciobacter marinus]RYA24669.1 hypothetical protein CRU96_02075 [Malaciobacter halophilus]